MSNATTLPLSEMTRGAKLRAMEELWDDLCHSTEGVSSPAWHGEILAERAQRVASGEAHFHEWEGVKARLLAPKQ
jgi:Putative addiction module component